MAKRKSRTRKNKSDGSRIHKVRGTRKSSISKMRATAKVRAKVESQAAKTKTPAQSRPKSLIATNRSKGIRFYIAAGRPSKQDFITVYGKRGHLMTWTERAKAGITAENFQQALAAKRA
jgi:hypothetical protein